MSGDLLRRRAVCGEVDAIKALLEEGANPCSVDEFGLSALHYAAWNGHVRCVEVFCINDIGRDEAGHQRSCVDLQSCKGFTALHLAALDGINGVECIGVLLSAGADRDLRDADGKTAAHASAEAGRDDCARALAVEMGSTKDLEDYRSKMEVKSKVQRAQWMPKAPKGTTQKRRVPKPHSLIMQEDEILPFSEQDKGIGTDIGCAGCRPNFAGKHAPETIRNLIVAKEQASINEARRKVLAESQDTSARRALETKFI